MIIFPPQEFITWTNMLVQFPWPIQLNDSPPTLNNWAGRLPRDRRGSTCSLTMIMQ